MPLATSSRSQLRSAIEATYGQVAAATGRRKVRMTGESLSYNLSFDRSKEIRSDRQIADQILLGAQAGGGFNAEFAYNEYDTFLESALQSTYLAFGTAGVSPTLTTPTFAASTLTQTGGTSFVTIEKGQWLQIRGCTGAHVVNNGIWQVSLTVAPTATVITFEGTPFTQVGAAAGTVTISTSRLKNGSALRTHNLEVEFNDITQFLTFVGAGFNKASLSAQANQVATLGFDVVAQRAMAMAGASNLVSTDSVSFPTAYDVMNSTSNVAKLLEGGVVFANTYVKSLSLDLDNALRTQMALGSLYPIGLGNGSVSITGKMSVYLADGNLYNKFVNNTLSSVAIGLADGPIVSANGYVITLPAIEFTNAQVQAGSIDQDMMIDVDFSAKIDTVSGRMILIDRFGAAAV